MKRLPHLAILLVTVALVAADKSEKKKKGDAEKIQGKWILVEVFSNGKRRDHSWLGFNFSGETVTLAVNGTRWHKDKKITFKLQPNKKPRELDMIYKRDGEENTLKAIYELSGDTLKICNQGIGQPRPDALITPAVGRRVIHVLKRVKGDDKK